jgi:hypothetical protein
MLKNPYHHFTFWAKLHNNFYLEPFAQGLDSFMNQWMLFPFMNTWLLVPFMNNNFYTMVNTYMPCSSMYPTFIPFIFYNTNLAKCAKVCKNMQMCDRTSHTLKRAARTSHARSKMFFARTSHICECARTCACAIFFSQLTVWHIISMLIVK